MIKQLLRLILVFIALFIVTFPVRAQTPDSTRADSARSDSLKPPDQMPPNGTMFMLPSLSFPSEPYVLPRVQLHTQPHTAPAVSDSIRADSLRRTIRRNKKSPPPVMLKKNMPVKPAPADSLPADTTSGGRSLTDYVPSFQSADSTAGQGLSPDSLHWDSVAAFVKTHSPRTVPEALLFYTGEAVYSPIRLLLMGGKVIVAAVDRPLWHRIAHDWLYGKPSVWGISPTYSHTNGLGIELYRCGLASPPSRLTGGAALGYYGRQNYELTLERVGWLISRSGVGLTPDHNADLFTGLRTRYHVSADEQFYGIGPRSRRNDRSNYGLIGTECTATLGYENLKPVILSGEIGVVNKNVMDGRSPDLAVTPDTLPGMDTEVTLLKGGVKLYWDHRDRPGNPASGQEAELSLEAARQLNKGNNSFNRASATVHQYIGLFYDRTLALKLSAVITRPAGKGTIPVYELARIGENETLRGFPDGRFQDRDRWCGSLEYRWPVYTPYFSRTGDAVLFYDVGQVTDNLFGHTRITDTAVSYGFGYRLYGAQGLMAKMELGFSREGVVLNLALN